jgi:acetyl-CoA carboxylase biotin carboxyl carrier protein
LKELTDVTYVQQATKQQAAPQLAPVAPVATPTAPVASAPAEDNSKYITIKSPMIGTFIENQLQTNQCL